MIEEKVKSPIKNLKQRIEPKFKWDHKFASKIIISIEETDFESTRVILHYGNWKCVCNVLFIKIPDDFLISLPSLGEGSFGSVYQLKLFNRTYALKVLKQKIDIDKEISDEFYQ